MTGIGKRLPRRDLAQKSSTINNLQSRAKSRSTPAASTDLRSTTLVRARVGKPTFDARFRRSLLSVACGEAGPLSHLRAPPAKSASRRVNLGAPAPSPLRTTGVDTAGQEAMAGLKSQVSPSRFHPTVGADPRRSLSHTPALASMSGASSAQPSRASVFPRCSRPHTCGRHLSRSRETSSRRGGTSRSGLGTAFNRSRRAVLPAA